jgi:hypothetical protein
MQDSCNNYLTIKFSSENHLHNFVSDYLDNYSGARNKKIISSGNRGILTTFSTHSAPDFEWLEKILQDNPNCWIKNDWEDYQQNVAGVWVGSWNRCPEDELIQVIYKMQWDDLSIEDRATLFGWRQGQRHN